MNRKTMKIYYDDINDLSKHINHYDYDKLLDDPLYCKTVLACSDNDVEYSSKHYDSIKQVDKFRDTKTITSLIVAVGDYNDTAYVYCKDDDEWFYLIPYLNNGMLALVTHNTYTLRKAPL